MRLYCVLILTVLQYSIFIDADTVKFGALCSDFKDNLIRETDINGLGVLGEYQDGGSRTHKGIAVVCKDGSTVYAPFDVTLKGQSKPYTEKSLINDGVKMEGEGLCFKLFYIRPHRYYGIVKKGQKIGIVLPMQKFIPGITSHIRVEMCDESDPAKYFYNDE